MISVSGRCLHMCHYIAFVRIHDQAFSIIWIFKIMFNNLYTWNIKGILYTWELKNSSDKKPRYFSVLNYSKWFWSTYLLKRRKKTQNFIELDESKCTFRLWNSSSCYVNVWVVVETMIYFSKSHCSLYFKLMCSLRKI